jgi:hypothetical protein
MPNWQAPIPERLVTLNLSKIPIKLLTPLRVSGQRRCRPAVARQSLVSGVAVSGDIHILPGSPRLSSIRSEFLGNGPYAPREWVGESGKRGPELAGRRRSLGGVLGQILVKERTSLYNTIMVGSCDPVKNFPVFSGFFL